MSWLEKLKTKIPPKGRGKTGKTSQSNENYPKKDAAKPAKPAKLNWGGFCRFCRVLGRGFRKNGLPTTPAPNPH